MAQCPNCSKEINQTLHKRKRKYCDWVCVAENHAKRYKKPTTGLSGGTVGAMAELMVAIELLKKGYEVYRSVSPASYCDLLALKRKTPSSTLFIEVRTGYKNLKGKVSYPKTKGEEDKQFAIVIHGEKPEIIYIPELID